MAGEDARLKAGLKSAEDELNLIKNQIQQTLLDIREHILDVTNPFNNVTPEPLDDEEQMSIEDSGAGGADGDGGGETVEEGEGPGLEEDVETIDGDEQMESLLDGGGGDSLGEDIEEYPEDEIIGGDGGGGGGGGIAEMLDGPAAQIDEDEGFDEDEEEAEAPEDELRLADEEETGMEQDLPEDNFAEEAPPGTRDGVADAVSAALAANVDLLTMASLVRWTAVTRDRIGANRLDILLDAYEMAGRISPEMKNVVKTLSTLGDEDTDGIPVRDVVTAMVRMEGVLNADESRESNRLLGLLLEMDEDPLDHLAA